MRSVTICLAASGPLLASWHPRSVAFGSTDSTPFTNGSVRPDFTCVWLGHPSCTITMGLLGNAAFHCLAISTPMAKDTPASSLRAVGMPVSASGLKNDVMMMPFLSAALIPGFAAWSSQMCRVAASIPWATTWSTLWVMTALSDLPSKAYTSALYFSFAYLFASANCAWWNTLDRSDTKNAIFMGFVDCSPDPLANAIGARSASATSNKIAFFIFSLLFRMMCVETKPLLEIPRDTFSFLLRPCRPLHVEIFKHVRCNAPFLMPLLKLSALPRR